MKLIIAAIVGGVLVFVAGFVTHVLLPLGGVGIKSVPEDEAVTTALAQNLKEPGFYMFPGGMETKGLSKEQADAAMKAYEAKYARGPHGVVIYEPGGGQVMSPKQLGSELMGGILAACFAALALSWAAPSLRGYVHRVVFVGVLGIFAGLASNISPMIWYGFPSDYTIATIVDEGIGWFVAGLGMAGIIKPRAA
jgi:hypothetical protein